MLMSLRHCRLGFLRISESEFSTLSSVMDGWKEELVEHRLSLGCDAVAASETLGEADGCVTVMRVEEAVW